MSLASSKDQLYRQTYFAVGVGLVANLALGAVKAVAGGVSGSVALVSDAVNSLIDTLTAALTGLALWYSRRPADSRHPYGYTRLEAVIASHLAWPIVGSAAAIAWEAVQRLSASPEPMPLWTLWIAGGNVAIKECLYRYKIGVGRRTNSSAIVATAWEHRTDALCALAVCVGLAASRLGGEALAAAEPAAALVVAGFVAASGTRLLVKGVLELLDRQADPSLVDEVRRNAETVPGVSGVETLRVRKSGLELLIDIHVEVDGTMNVGQGHQIGHDVKDRLLGEFPRVRDVLVHVEPAPNRFRGGRIGMPTRLT